MRSLKTFAFMAAATALVVVGQARAADMPMLAPPPLPDYGGWYLRGDIGMSNQKTKGLESAQFGPVQWLDKGGFDSAPIFGIGLGYRHNNWFRWDITGEYRGASTFHALDRFSVGAGAFETNDYRAKKSEWLFLWNAYLDLGTWHGITPFIGAGVGTSRNTISQFRDINIYTPIGGYAHEASTWEFAWALHAGIAYDVTPNFTIELAYRYVDLGDATTGRFPDDQGACPCSPVKFKDITSHDLRFGVRWALADMGVSHWSPKAPPPIVGKY
jgi:opacity protein-like surface antigen